MGKVSVLLAMALAIVLSASPSWALTYECVDATGQTIFTDSSSPSPQPSPSRERIRGEGEIAIPVTKIGRLLVLQPSFHSWNGECLNG